MRMITPLMITILALSGCAVMDRLKPQPKAEPLVLPAAVSAAPALGKGKTAATLDTTSAAEKTAALSAAPAASETLLGTVAVSLGSPAEQGFWLQSTLVKGPGKGRIETEGGTSVSVDLRPGTSGAQLSLAAFRALGLSLTALPQVRVFAQ